jgi:hypothetical protein
VDVPKREKRVPGTNTPRPVLLDAATTYDKSIRGDGKGLMLCSEADKPPIPVSFSLKAVLVQDKK